MWLLALTACSQPTWQGRPIAPIMSSAYAWWLERDGRAEEEGTDRLMAALPVKAGDTVADLGCGTGFHARRLARAVGPEGVVWCVDLQQDLLDEAMARANADRLTNLRPILGEEDRMPVAAGSLDLVLLVDVYHELSDPGPMLASIRDALAPGGVAAVVEFRAEGDSAAFIKPEHRMTADQVVREWTGAGFTVAGQVESLPTQHLVLFRR